MCRPVILADLISKKLYQFHTLHQEIVILRSYLGVTTGGMMQCAKNYPVNVSKPKSSD